MNGTPFGRYRLVEVLGRGGMGEVWRGYDTVIDRTVAIKTLLPHFAQDSTFEHRFRREAKAAARLDDPHVVPIYDFGEIDGRLYVAMRLINGHELQTLLDRGPLDIHRAVDIVDQVASALQAAHEVGLVHRDVKPSNILVTNEDFAYLIDFGIARAAGETGITSTGATIGTWSYMAPERFRGEEIKSSSDVYALACVLHQALTGQLPFPGNTLEQVAMAHMTAPPPKPSAQRQAIPMAMDEVIATGLAKSPKQRYSTARELATAAQAALTTPTRQSRSGSPQSTPPNLTKPAATPRQDDFEPRVATTQHARSPESAARTQPAPQRRLLQAATVVPVTLAVLLLGAAVFAVTQVLRPDPKPSTTAPQWQPYVDYAKQFAVALTSLSAQSADSDIQRILDGSTGSFHDDFANQRSAFTQTVVSSQVTEQGTVNSAALDSINGTTAQVLVASTTKVTNNAGAAQDPRTFRLALQVEKTGDAYKVSKVEFVQ